VALLFFVNGVVLGSWLPRLPELRDRFGLGLASVGLALAVGGLGGLAGSALSGVVVGRVGARQSALWPAAAVMVLLPLLALVPHALLFASVLGLIAVTDAVADVGMNALAARVEAARGRSIFTRVHGVWSLGSLSGAAVSTAAVAGGVGLAPQLVVTAGACLAAVVWAAHLLPESEIRPRPEATAGRGVVAFWLAIAGAGAAFVEATPSDWSALYLSDVLGAAAATAGAGFLGLTLGMVVGRMGGDFVVDRIGPRRTLAGALAFVAVAVALMTSTSNLIVALIAFTVWGLGVSVLLPLMYRLAGSHPAFAEGHGLAALTQGSRLGFLAGPAAIGSMAEATTLPVAFVVVVGLALLATLWAAIFSLRSDN